MADMTAIPAKILLQVRDGVLNEIASFEIQVAETIEHEPNAAGATKTHKVSSSSIIRALVGATRKAILEARRGGDYDATADDLAAMEAYFQELADWIKESKP